MTDDTGERSESNRRDASAEVNEGDSASAKRGSSGRRRSSSRRGFLAGLGALGVAGIGGQSAVGSVGLDGAAGGQETTTTTTDGEQDTPTRSQDGATTLEDARSAVIRVDTEGTFVPPGEGTEQANTPGGGSGFIIDSSGIAVTANHVVTGAGTLEVVTGEDTNRTYNARVLGASECADLAVIQIAGSDFPSLEWADEGAVESLAEVFALGFPVSPGGVAGQYQYTVTRGIISQTDANGETVWASVDSVIQHDADLLPGNSGGPLVTRDGRVVGVNYAGVLGFGSLNFAIGAGIARGIVETLAQGENHEWIGINGQAWISPDQTVSGIWVSSVASGSPADEAGVLPGDAITTMEGLSLATDGTMATYCDVLRSRNPGDQLKVEVLRQGTGELLVGEINGDPLEPLPGRQTVPPGEQFQTVTDATGSIRVTTPGSWTDVQNRTYPNGDPELLVSPDVDVYLNTWEVPGLLARVRSDADPNDLQGVLETSIEEFGDFQSVCGEATDSAFTNAYLTGVSRRFVDCGDTGATNVFLAARSVAEPQRVLVSNVQLVEPGDEEAYGQIAASLQLVAGVQPPGEGTPTTTADGGEGRRITTAPNGTTTTQNGA